MGTYYKGGASHYHSLAENVSTLKKHFSFSRGFFGSKSPIAVSVNVRNISSKNPVATAKQFYDEAAHGGIQHVIKFKNGDVKGYTTNLKDGTVITWRHTSSSDGTPAVDISIKKSVSSTGIKRQKIHFVKMGEKNEKN